jgi:hypothetical protein
MPADEGAVDADNLYVGASGAIYQVPKSGASPTTLLPSGGPSGPPLRFAGGSLYWITDTTAVYSQENIVMLSPPSATPTTLVTVDAGQDPQDPYLPYAFITDLDVEGHTVAYVVGQGGGGNSPPSSSVAEVGGADLGAGGAPLRVGGTAVYFATADRTGIARYDGATGKTSVIVPGPLAETDVLALALTPHALYFATASCIYRTGL